MIPRLLSWARVESGRFAIYVARSSAWRPSMLMSRACLILAVLFSVAPGFAASCLAAPGLPATDLAEELLDFLESSGCAVAITQQTKTNITAICGFFIFLFPRCTRYERRVHESMTV